MRFFEDGPIIPDQLLDRRDQGRVVFLCGAGISFNSGMPSFFNLTKYVVDFFDPPKNSIIESEFRPWLEENETGVVRPKTALDQIFHLLHQEYGREEVNALVADRLRGAGTKSIEHSVIARISSDADGKPQIVTTNFDLLFEQALGEALSKRYEPPGFPDINHGVPLTGITYLHGRLQEKGDEQHPYVLSSADFGRAYLSEAWATNFIRSLLKSYTVVMIGYQAEDPPIKYLLQGLNHDGKSDRSNLYAFDKGEPEEIEAKWRDRGVTAIACKDYPIVWRSLAAWAERADDPRQWRANVINLALKGPRSLAAFERGQVAHIIRTTPGARLFARTNPSPTPEWLCVFDAWCRMAKKSSGYGEGAETFDPFVEYGLDDDPPRPNESDDKSNFEHDHLLEWRRGDTNPPDFHRLSRRQLAGFESMPPRLLHLSFWITKNLDTPITAWWAIRQRGLHPRLVQNIKQELRRNRELHPNAIRTWSLILEYQSDSRNFSFDNGWFQIKDRIKSEGWTPSILRDFQRVTAPILLTKLQFGIGASRPPLGGWAETGIEGIARWELKFPDRRGVGLDIHDEILDSLVRIFEGHFRQAIGLLEDLNPDYFSVPTCYAEREVDGHGHSHRKDEFFEWFLELFARLVSYSPKIARAYASTWPADQKYYFRKLKLFALNHVELFEANEAAETLLAISQVSFWDTDVCRELIFLICDRWEEFSIANKVSLAERLLSGPDKMNHWSDEEYPSFKDEMTCRYTRYLILQGRKITDEQTSRLDEIISKLPEWNDGWARSFFKEHLSSVTSIDTDEAPDTIIDLPVNEIVERAKAEHTRTFDSNTEKRPFAGLVKANPRKALASLSYLAKRDEYPQAFWSMLINNWPEETKSRLYCVFLHRLRRLPYEAICELSHPIGRWLKEKLLLTFQFDEALAWSTFDHLVSGLISDKGAATSSGLGDVYNGGKVIQRSRRTYGHAINGPIGNAVEGLQNTLASLNLEREMQIPEQFKSRFEYLTAAPGEGGDHAVATLTLQISWLYYLDPVWVRERVMPWFNFDHDFSEPAWNGYLSASKLPPQELGAILKPSMLKLFPVLYQWSWDEHLAKVAAQIVTELAVFRSDKSDGLNAIEARHCLRYMNDRNRQDAVFRLSAIGQRKEGNWSKHVIPFIHSVWPRERSLRTTNMVSSWVSLLANSGENFPEVLSAVRRYLVPVGGESHWLMQFGREVGGNPPLTIHYPFEVLELLDATIPNSPENVPYDLAQILDLLEETEPTIVSDRRFLRLMNLIEQT